jgi:asparagine N-glycosylation enzyme membrane subunit Stt3
MAHNDGNFSIELHKHDDSGRTELSRERLEMSKAQSIRKAGRKTPLSDLILEMTMTVLSVMTAGYMFSALMIGSDYDSAVTCILIVAYTIPLGISLYFAQKKNAIKAWWISVLVLLIGVAAGGYGIGR